MTILLALQGGAQAQVAAADSLALQVADDAVQIAVTVTGSDAALIAAADAVQAILAALESADALAIVADDAGFVAFAAPPVGISIVLVESGAVVVLEAASVAASDAVAAALADVGAVAVTTPSYPGPAAIPSYAAEFRRYVFPLPPSRRIVVASDVARVALIERHQPTPAEIEADDEECLMLL